MDQSSVPVDPACPPAQSSAPDTRHDSTPRRSATPAITPERRPRTPERFLRTPQRSTRTPDRRVRTPVRRARSCSESRDSRSNSPVSRSSSVEFPTRDGPPVNFTAAMDPDIIKRVFMMWLRQRDPLKSTLLKQSERPERLCWTWVIRRWLTEYRGWTSRLFRTRWFLQHV